jgi:hypothetical protein
MDENDVEPFVRYLTQVTGDPLRVAILGAHALVEEMIEDIIAEAVPNSECFKVPRMRFVDKLEVLKALDSSITESEFWPLIQSINSLRNAAGHRNYESLREPRFRELTAAFRSVRPNFKDDDEMGLLHSVAAYCYGELIGLKNSFRE